MRSEPRYYTKNSRKGWARGTYCIISHRKNRGQYLFFFADLYLFTRKMKQNISQKLHILNSVRCSFRVNSLFTVSWRQILFSFCFLLAFCSFILYCTKTFGSFRIVTSLIIQFLQFIYKWRRSKLFVKITHCHMPPLQKSLIFFVIFRFIYACVRVNIVN